MSFSQENIPNFLPFSSLSYLTSQNILFTNPSIEAAPLFHLETLLSTFCFSSRQISFLNLKQLPGPSWILVLYAIYSAIFLQHSQSYSCWNCLSQLLSFLSYWCSVTCFPHLPTNFCSISTAVVFDLLPFSTYIFFPGKHTWSNSQTPLLHRQLRDILACFYLCRI